MQRNALTTYEISGFCDVSPRTVVQWINEGKIKAFKTPGNHSRVKVPDFIQFLKDYNMPIPDEMSSVKIETDNKKILIVDDDKNMAKSIQRALMLKGDYDLEAAFDGFDAGRKVAMFRPDLVILDVKMPGMNGFEVTRNIKEPVENAIIKIIAISAFFDMQGKKKMIAAGADACLDKPFSQEELLTTMEKVFAGQKIES